MAHTLTKLVYHCVFSTKRRRLLLSDPISERLNGYLARVASRKHMHLIRADGMRDHRHLLLQVGPAMTLADAVGKLKANSSRWIKQTFPRVRDFAWQTGYAAFSVSPSNIDAVVSYLDEQKRHHARRTFDEELIALLERHAIPYDPQFLAD
jgi:REP element-mobilizing transposase RayT